MAIEWKLAENLDAASTWIGTAPSGQTFIIEDLDQLEGPDADRPRFLTGYSEDFGVDPGESRWEPIDGADTFEEAKQIAESTEAEWVADPDSRPSSEPEWEDE